MFLFKLPLFYLIMAQKHRSGDDGKLDMLKRNHDVYVCTYSEKIVYIGFSNIFSVFRFSPGILDKGRLLYMSFWKRQNYGDSKKISGLSEGGNA